MQRFAKVLLRSAAVVLIPGAIVFSTSQASAQFSINIGGLGGLIPHGSYGRSYHSRRGRTHEARHERRSKEREAKDDDSDKDNDRSGHKPDRVELSGHAPPETAASGSPPANATPPSAPPPPATPAPTQSSADVPAFTPEK
jgi:hypothetical protein